LSHLHEIKNLKKILLFSDLSDSELETLRSFTHLKKFNKGEILFFETEPYQGLYCLLDGCVKLYKISKEGREHIVHIIHPGNTFAEVPIFENNENVIKDNTFYPVNAMSIEDFTEVLIVSAKPFLELLKDTPDLCFKLLSTLSKRLKKLNSHIENISLLDVKKRLAKYIIAEFEKSVSQTHLEQNQKHLFLKEPDSIELNISKYDLASHLGTITETLSRTLKKFQEEGLIDVQGKSIIIRNLKKLKKCTE